MTTMTDAELPRHVLSYADTVESSSVIHSVKFQDLN